MRLTYSKAMDEILKRYFEQLSMLPELSYDSFQPDDQQIFNFIDAYVFGNRSEALVQNLVLAFYAKDDKVIERLKLEEHFLTSEISSLPGFLQTLLMIKKEQVHLGSVEIETVLKQVPETFRLFVKFQLMMIWGWQKLSIGKPLLNISEAYPFYPLQYSLPVPSIETNKIPLIFFEPVKEDLSKFLKVLKGQPAVFAFTDLSLFFQMLQFPAFADSLCEPEHLIYILELYPNQLFQNQSLKQGELHPVYFAHREQMEPYMPLLVQSLQECLMQPKEEMHFDTLAGDWLYEIANRLRLSVQQHRLGMSRAPALQLRAGQTRWYDPHKGALPPDKPLGPPWNGNMLALLSNMARQRVPRPRAAKKKIILAHIVSQIVSGGHAPTRLLENLVLNHDRDKFETIVIATDFMRELPLEYPHNFHFSPSSDIRGDKMIGAFEEVGVKTFINRKSSHYASNAVDLCNLLKERLIDVAIFHGPDIVNTMAAQMTDVPLRVLFEHGSQPYSSGFDLAILSSTAACEIYCDLYKKIGTKAVALPFAVDVRKGWFEEPYTRDLLRLPEEGLIMTTISTKLDDRLSGKFCHAIAEILKREPKAWYVPMGHIRDLERVTEIFEKYGVADRFQTLGSVTNPSQYARCMDLYLNDFPIGSGLALLDAMAAGLPVVTMYDMNGPQASRYGGNYFGVERAITSGDPEEYIDLACKLLKDPKMHKEWSQHALRQYEKFADVKGHVKEFETIILQEVGLIGGANIPPPR